MILGIHHVSMKCESREDFARALAFYEGLLGCPVVRSWPEGVMLDAGNTRIEIFRNGPGIRSKGAIRHLAFAADDVDEIAARIKAAGYDVFVGPKDTVIPSDPPLLARMAFCTGPLGEEIEFFREKPEETPREGLFIRPLAMADYDALYAMWMASPNMGFNNLDDSREGIAKYLQRNPSTSFAAFEDGELAGAILAGHDGRRGFIHHTCVAARCRGRGIGSALVARCLAALKAEGIHKTALLVFKYNEAGNAFWEKQGFTRREDVNYRNLALTELIRIDT